MSVIVSRALPDVRDGLKPVQRRILWAMHDANLRPDRPFVKCARVVGDVMANYHPHGDTSIYDALVRMGQPFSLTAPLDRQARQLRLALRSARRVAATPSAGCRSSRWSCSPGSTKAPSTSNPTTTRRAPSRSCCPRASRTCS